LKFGELGIYDCWRFFVSCPLQNSYRLFIVPWLSFVVSYFILLSSRAVESVRSCVHVLFLLTLGKKQGRPKADGLALLLCTRNDMTRHAIRQHIHGWFTLRMDTCYCIFFNPPIPIPLSILGVLSCLCPFLWRVDMNGEQRVDQ
jgi:hypothetical protein